MVELNLLNTGRRASSHNDGGGVVATGLAGGLFGNANVFTADGGVCAPLNAVGLCCSGKKFTIELVGDNEREPVGDARSDPVLILNGGVSGSEFCIPAFTAFCAEAAAAKRAWKAATLRL